MIKKDPVNIALVPCSKCGRVFKAEITQDILDNVERYPFSIVLMHISVEKGKKEIHTLVAYIDKYLNCRHVTVLLGRRLFITPYVFYNPDLLILSSNWCLTKNNYVEDDVKT